MRKLLIHRGFEVLLDDEDFDRVAAFRWHFRTAKSSSSVRGKVDGIQVELARFIVGASPKELIDHANGNTLDNQKTNLRFATSSQNCRNRKSHRNSRSRFKGVHHSGLSRGIPRSRPWTAHIYTQKKLKHLGMFATEEEAARVYDDAARIAFGEFACVNFPKDGERCAVA